MSTVILGIAVGAVYGLVAVGIVLVYKASRVLNFAQAEFGTFALYLAWFLSSEQDWVPWGVGALLALAAMTAVGAGFERFVVRPMGDATKLALSVATIGLLLLMFAVELLIWKSSPRIVQPPISGSIAEVFGFVLTPMHLMSIGALAALAVGLGYLVARTRMGLALLAVAEDPPTARLMGVPYHRVSATTWAVAGFLGAAAGLLIGPLQGVFAPLSLTSSTFTRGLAAALLGGLTSLPGAFVGGLAVGVIEAFLVTEFTGVLGIGSYGMLGVIMLVLLVRPQGLFGRTA